MPNHFCNLLIFKAVNNFPFFVEKSQKMVENFVDNLVKTFWQKDLNKQLTRYEQTYEQAMLITFAFNSLYYSIL